MNLPLVVRPADLKNVMPANLKIVDLRSAEAYAESHLADAVHLDTALLNRTHKPVGGLLPGPAAVNILANAIGLQKNEHILAYDAGAGSAAARLVWVMHAYGFDNISWLDGGFNAWSAAGLPTTTQPAEIKDATATLSFTPGNVISVEELMSSLTDDQQAILDVRSEGEYNGTDVRSARGGHVPNAIHSEWTQAFNEAGGLKSDAELAALFTDKGMNPEQHVVVYCQTHQRSALTYLVLKHLGYEKVSAIDGAWSAWGNREDTPIET